MHAPRMLCSAILVLAASPVACGVDPDPATLGVTAAAPTDETGSASDELESSGTSEAEPTPPKIDAGAGSGNGIDPDAGVGCTKIDFLFVIDDSGSMSNEQAALGNSFPGFIEALQEELPTATDYHIMVVDSTGGDSPECAGKIGAANTSNGYGSPCFPAGHPPYLVAGDPLTQGFFCSGFVGTNGAGAEQVMPALINAISPGFNAPGGCNEGFLRADAILVVVVITDEYAGDSASYWANYLVSAKGGDPTAVVPLAIVSDRDIDVDEPICPPGEWAEAEPNPGLVEFVELFEHGGWGSICADSYDEFFAEAIKPIEASCEVFEPVG